MASCVLIHGDGVAAGCCAQLLARASVPCSRETAARPRVPVIMLGDAAQHLLADVFENRNLFDGLPRIHKRIVAWGRDSKPMALPHSAVVLSEQALLDRIGAGLSDPGAQTAQEASWTIFASRPLPRGSAEHHFGSRLATASSVKLKPGVEPGACWIESLEQGWLFLLPLDEQAWLLSVGATPEALLAPSRLIAAQIEGISHNAGSFPCYPRVADPIAGPGWLACGTAALGFDPLCGDGTGHAVREAILACAVIRAAREGGDTNALIAHYWMRLVAGLQRHLKLCRDFYESGHGGSWWEHELKALDRGLTWCNGQLGPGARFRFRLNGFALEAMD